MLFKGQNHDFSAKKPFPAKPTFFHEGSQKKLADFLPFL
jgi:hypothetical protein